MWTQENQRDLARVIDEIFRPLEESMLQELQRIEDDLAQCRRDLDAMTPCQTAA